MTIVLMVLALLSERDDIVAALRRQSTFAGPLQPPAWSVMVAMPSMEQRMSASGLRHRLATPSDLDTLRALMEAAISELQKPFLGQAEIESSRRIMGLDTQLIDAGTYFFVEIAGAVAGWGGWSRRATLYGGDCSPGRDP